jgi:hypothetical protein
MTLPAAYWILGLLLGSAAGLLIGVTIGVIFGYAISSMGKTT